MTWQKKVRLGIALFLVGFVAVVVVALRRPKPPAVEQAVPVRTDAKSVMETSGGLVYDHLDTEHGRVIFQVRADGQRVYEDGRSVYTNATLNLPERNGRSVSVRADEAEVLKTGVAVGKANLKGNVRMTTSDGVEVRAGEAAFNDADGVLTVPGPVEFTRARMKGSGIGATYDQNRQVLWLLDRAHITVAADDAGTGAMEASAGAAGLARGEHYARLIKGARVTTDGRVIEAEDILIRLTEDGERIQVLELRGNSRITGGPQAMSARDIDLTYGADGRSLQFAKLMEDAVVQLPGVGRAPGRRISGRFIDLAMSPDGATVTHLSASENVQLDLPADGATPARRIRSVSLTAGGAPGAGLQDATFSGNVDYRETRAGRGGAAALNRTARAMRLTVKTSPGLGAIQQADFRGNVHITDGEQIVADAPRVLYRVADDSMDLSPGDGDPGKEPQVTDGRVTIIARTLSLTLGSRRIKAETRVRSTIVPTPRTAKAGQDARIPSMLEEDKPVNVTANRLDYDGAAGLATYAGDARLWQDKGANIKADTLVVDDKSGNLTGTGSVATLMTVTDVDPVTGARTDTLTSGKAESFVYDEAKRMATYTTKAQLQGAQGNIAADKIELYLAATTGDLDRVEAYGAVTVKEGNRTATGTRLTYTAADDRYVMTGEVGTTPVVVIEKADKDCTRTQGTELTFRRATEGISMKQMTYGPCRGGPPD